MTLGLVAHLSYRFYERPFIRLKQRFSRVQSSDEAGSHKPEAAEPIAALSH